MPLVRKYAGGWTTGRRQRRRPNNRTKGVVSPPRRVAVVSFGGAEDPNQACMKYGSHIVGNRYRAQAAGAVQARLERRWFVYECVR